MEWQAEFYKNIMAGMPGHQEQQQPQFEDYLSY